MNRLSLARRTQIIGALVEGNSIRSTERMTDTHRDTVMRLMVEVGTGCAALQGEITRGLTCKRAQVDEIWAFVGKKQKQVTLDDNRSRVGDQYTFVDERTTIVGTPDRKHISTSIIERQNLTMRMSMRRFTRLTNAFSKKVENHWAAVALHFAHYNLVRLHRTLRTTPAMAPAMAANVSSCLWSLEELVERTSN